VGSFSVAKAIVNRGLFKQNYILRFKITILDNDAELLKRVGLLFLFIAVYYWGGM
jgi:hypothetical protein